MPSTRPGQFKVFMARLMENAPKGYKPWLIPCQKNGKDPDVKLSWKTEKSRLTTAQAVRRLKNNWGNVGIAGKPDDQLILVDVDDPSILDEVKDTLKIRSRSRRTEEEPAIHAFYWADPEDDELPTNIPTDKGEVRSSDQYVVAPGSYVPCTEEELQEKVEAGEISREAKKEILEDDFRGYYTVYENKEVATIKFEELPEVFREEHKQRKNRSEKALNRETDFDPEKVESKDKSALFELEITDLTARGLTGRDAHPLHISETGANWCISQGVGHCWRHEVSLNAIQFLCVESGYLDCYEAGTPHKGHGSAVIENNEAIWEAWKHAKEQGYIPKDDPIPTRAMKYIAKKEGIYKTRKNGLLPPHVYEKVNEIVGEKY